jgi:glutaredoxin-dependent peroxiredoxin
MPLAIGSQAPNFTLYNSDKKQVSLSDFKGQKVLLLFFPQSFTGVCTTELCSVRDNLAFYNNTNAVVLGISVDSIFTLAKFKEEQKLNFDLLSDFNKTTSKAYDCLYEDFVFDMKGVSRRAAFVIDLNGGVQYAEVLESAGDLPNFEAIQKALAAI